MKTIAIRDSGIYKLYVIIIIYIIVLYIYIVIQDSGGDRFGHKRQ